MTARAPELGWTAALALGLALLSPGRATAQLGLRAPRAQAPSANANANANASSLRHRLGVDIADALLKSSEPEERQRGFERLSSVGTAQALDLLLKAFEPGGAARSARDRLVAVRALAPHARAPQVRELLVRVMVGVGSNPERAEAIDSLIEHAAALALAASGDDAALSALSKALRQPGHVADTARDALLAFPPRNLQIIVQGRSSPSKTLVSLLQELGDARAIPALREIVRSAPPDVRAEAAVALAKFGVSETLELARHWLTHETSTALRLASARILLELHAADAAAAVRELLLAEPTHRAALELAGGASLPELSPTLIELARKAEGEDRSAVFAAIGLTGTPAAFSFLGGALSAQPTSSAAALALALAPSKEAQGVLERALAQTQTRRTAARASIVRLVALGRAPSGLDEAIAELAASRDASDRAVSLAARAVLSPEHLAALIQRATGPDARALARVALVPGAAGALAERLASEQDESVRTALSACLASPAAAELVPTDVLLTLIDARGLGAPLAALALAARDSPTLRPKILSLLASDDALLRSHVARGLGQSEESSALGVLERAYRFETNDDVRLAIVQALATRREPARSRALALARSLDASRSVREAAALALARAEPATERGRASVWLEFSAASANAADPARPATAGALVIGSTGLAVPAFADPDGVLLLPALPAGGVSLRLAAPARTEDAPRSKPP